MSTALNGQAYDYKVVRQFTIMTVVWGVIGMAMGVWIASQLAWPAMNLDLPWTTFGRLRPLHTSLVIFGFAGSAQFIAVAMLGAGAGIASIIATTFAVNLRQRRSVRTRPP